MNQRASDRISSLERPIIAATSASIFNSSLLRAARVFIVGFS
jgi:hypothetical protein